MSNVAANERWQVERIGSPGGDRLELVGADGSRRVLSTVPAPAQLGRPALDGDRLVFHRAGRSGSELIEIDLATGVQTTLRSTVRGVMLNPSLSGERLLYVHSSFERQKLKLGARVGQRDGSRDAVVYSQTPTARRDRGVEGGRHKHHEGYRNGYGARLPQRPRPGIVQTLWETSFSGAQAVVTRLQHRPDGGVDTAVLSFAPK